MSPVDPVRSGLFGERLRRGIPWGKPFDRWTRYLPLVILATGTLGVFLYFLAELVKVSWGAWTVYLDRIARFSPGDHLTSITLLLASLAVCFLAIVFMLVGARRGRHLLIIGLLVIVVALLNVLWADDVWDLGLPFGLLSLLLPLSWIVLLFLLVEPWGILWRSRRAALLASAVFCIVLSGVAFLVGFPEAESESDEDRLGALHDTVLFFEPRIGIFAGLCFLLFLVLGIVGVWRGEGEDPDRWRVLIGLDVFFVAFIIAIRLGLESFHRYFVPAYGTPFTGFAVLLVGGIFVCLSLFYSFYSVHSQGLKRFRWGGVMLISLAVSSVGIGLVMLGDVVRAQNPISTNPLPRWVGPYSVIMEISAFSFFCVGILLLVLGWKLWDRLSLLWRRPSLHLVPMILVISLPAILFVASLVIQQVSEVALRLQWQPEALPEAGLFSPVTYRILWRTGFRWAGVAVSGILGILSILLTISTIGQIKPR